MKLKKAKSNKFDLGLIAIGAVGTALTAMIAVQQLSPAAQTYRASRATAKQDNALAQRQSNENRLEDAADKYAAQKAAERYNAGCVMPFVPVQCDAYAQQVSILAEGEPVINPINGKLLSNGQLACDDRGMTFEIKHGVASDAARATDMGLVNKRFADYAGWNPKARRSDVFLDESPLSQSPAK